jgi:hypothetical protein
MVRAWHERGMAGVNQTLPHCVNQMGKTHSKPLAARHGRGAAWARHAVCESALSGFDGLEVAYWPLVPKLAGSHPAEAVGFLGRKNPQHDFLRREVKPLVPCRSFTACKRSLNVMCQSEFRQNYRTFLAHSSTSRRWVLSCGDAWIRLVAKVGTPNSDSTISLRLQCVVKKHDIPSAKVLHHNVTQ